MFIRIYNKIRWTKHFCNWLIKLVRVNHRNTNFLFFTPIHANLGDHAIARSEYEVLSSLQIPFIEIYEPLHIRRQFLFKKIVRKRPILIHGGGFIGSLWPFDNTELTKIISSFSENRIFIFPQTLYYDKTAEAQKLLREDQKVYAEHPSLTICARERYSYEFAKRTFPRNNVVLIPDMVLRLNYSNQKNLREGVMFCLRKDHEKAIDEDTEQFIKKTIENYFSTEQIRYSDTVIDHYVMPKDRNQTLDGFWKYVASQRLVITDRLHGMVFAAITGTPCIVKDNCNYKVNGTYEWISANKQNDYIEYYAGEKYFAEQIERLLSKEKCIYHNEHLQSYYDKLSSLLCKEE